VSCCLAAAGHSLRDEQLLQSAAAHLAATIATYSPATASNALMACAALGFTTPQLSAAAGAAVLSGLQQQQQTRYGPKQVAQAAFALAKLQACDQQLLDATAAAFGREAQAYSPPLLSMLVWVCVLAKQRLPQGLLQQLLACSRAKLGDFSGDQVRRLCCLQQRAVLLTPSCNQGKQLNTAGASHCCPAPAQLVAAANTTAYPTHDNPATLAPVLQLASLLRGVLAMPAQQQQDNDSNSNSTVAPLLAEAQALLPQKLPDVSTAVLTELIKSLATHCRNSTALCATQQQGPAAAAAPADGGADPSTASDSSTAGVEQVRSMLQDCMAEWSTAQRLRQLTVPQAAAVQQVLLEGCESLQGLAAAAQQVSTSKGIRLSQPVCLCCSLRLLPMCNTCVCQPPRAKGLSLHVLPRLLLCH
jgi:hypothetical protein